MAISTPQHNYKEDENKAVRDGSVFVQHLKNDAQTAMNQVHEKYDDLRSYAGQCSDKLEKHVTDKPVQSVAIAFAAGAVLSLLFARR